MKGWKVFVAAALCSLARLAAAQNVQVVDIPTRPGVTERVGVLAPEQPKATVLLLSGGEGRLQILGNGSIMRDGNFLIRSRDRFAANGLAVVLLDTPSDRSSAPFLGGGFRESAEHAADIGAVVAWARAKWSLPVWLVGTSRGTESAAQASIQLTGAQAPDGVVLSSTILARSRGGEPVTEMDLARIHVPVLVVHHEEDNCVVTPPAALPALMAKLPPGAELKTYTGGSSQGPACEAFAHHGFNGIEDRVVADMAAWLLARH